MSEIKLDTNGPDKAANVAARAAILFARVSGFIAENKIREQTGYAPAYDANCFEAAIDECFPELREPRGEG